MSDETTEGPTCSKCGQNPPGPGGILCAHCRNVIESERLPGAVFDAVDRDRLIAEAIVGRQP